MKILKRICSSCGSEIEVGNDRRHKAILEFIKNNPNVLQSEVIREMKTKHIASVTTTYTKLQELVMTGKVKETLSNNGHFHHYTVIGEMK